MGKEAVKKSFGAIFSFVEEGVGSAIKAVTPLWDSLFGTDGVFNTLWKSITKLPGDILRAAKDLFTLDFKALWKDLGAIVADVKNVYTALNNVAKEANLLIDKIRKDVFGDIFALWDNIKKLTDSIVRVVAIFDQKLALAINDFMREVYKYTLGQVDFVYREVKTMIGDVKRAIDSSIGEVVRLMESVTRPLIAFGKELENFTKYVFDDALHLKKETVQFTTRKYGMTMWTELTGPITHSDVDSLREGMVDVSVPKWLVDGIDQMDEGKDGPWADVHNYVEDVINRCDKGLDPLGFVIDENLLSGEQASDYHQAIEQYDKWEGEALISGEEAVKAVEPKPEDIPEVPSYTG